MESPLEGRASLYPELVVPDGTEKCPRMITSQLSFGGERVGYVSLAQMCAVLIILPYRHRCVRVRAVVVVVAAAAAVVVVVCMAICSVLFDSGCGILCE